MRVRLPLAVGAAAILAAVGWWLASRPMVVEVPPGEAAGRVVRSVPDGSIVRLLPGAHASFEVTRGLTIEGAPGAVVRGPVEVIADGVRLRELVIEGGESGISIREADHVVIERVVVRGAELHGIEIAPGSVSVRDCRIEGLISPYGQGFEVRNSTGRPRTVVEGCSVFSGQEGLVAHVSRVEFRDNVVAGTSLRAIVVTEMSEGLVEGNDVRAVRGIGLYCGDESHCEMRGNSVRGVAPGATPQRSHAGYGAVALYHATMRLSGNSFEDVAAHEPVGLFLGSVLTERFPLSVWPAGWRGLLPGLPIATGLALAGLLVVRVGLEPWARRRRRRLVGSGGGIRRTGPVLGGLIVGGFVVQSFHMLEHVVQVFQVYVAEGEERSGILGSSIDNEWVHFVFNVAVLAFLASLAWLVWSGRLGARPAAGGPAVYLAAAAAIQTWHMAEHAAKIVQHLLWKIDPAPGLVGGSAGLVWFHFGINLAVYAGFAVGFALLVKWRALEVAQGARVGRAAALAGTR